jgi:hypothetical protein
VISEISVLVWRQRLRPEESRQISNEFDQKAIEAKKKNHFKNKEKTAKILNRDLTNGFEL